MPRAESGSTKAIANAIKAKGLGRLRWYCQICEKQCRDENGFQAHTRSEPHLRKIMLVGPKAGQTIAQFSRQFQYDFVLLLRTRHSTNRVQANKVYNEYIQDKHHVHMNATRWVTLNGFIMTLGKAGTVKVDEDDKGLWITWIDDRPETLARQAALQKRDRATMDGEERERKMLEDQIARARAAEEGKNEMEAGLQKAPGEKITLSFAPTPVGAVAGPSGTSGTEAGTERSPVPAAASEHLPAPTAEESKPAFSLGGFGTIPAAVTPASVGNPLKRPAGGNVFKSAKVPKTERSERAEEDSGAGTGTKKTYISEAERLMKEDQMRKAQRQGQGYSGFGPRRGGGR